MPFAYEQLLETHNLKISELPDEVEIAVTGLIEIQKGANIKAKANAKQGKEYAISDKSMRKMKQMDAWACRGIIEYLNDKELSTDAPHEIEEIIEEIKVEDKAQDQKHKDKSYVLSIEGEIANLFKTNKHSVTIEELATLAGKSYKLIMSSYNDSDVNGIETSNYSLIESTKGLFKVSKK